MLLIISCNQNKDQLEIIYDSWLKYSKIPYVIVIGNPDQIDNYIFDESSRKLYIKSKDDYDSLPFKVYYGISIIKKLWNPSFIIKIDDDIFLNPIKLYSWIYDEPHCDYEGVKASFEIDIESSNTTVLTSQKILYCGGPMYFISSNAINIITQHMKPGLFKDEDVNIGYTLSKFNIFPKTVYLYTNSFDLLLSELYENIFAIHDNKKLCFHKNSEISKLAQVIIDGLLVNKTASANIKNTWLKLKNLTKSLEMI